MLDGYIEATEYNKAYIAFNILDQNEQNEQSVESLYQKAEVWINESDEMRNHSSLDSLKFDYDKIQIEFDTSFTSRLTNLARLIDLEPQNTSGNSAPPHSAP